MSRKILDKLETLNEEYLILNEEEMRYVRKGVKSRDWDVRDVVAEILVGWYTPENEQILYNLIRSFYQACLYTSNVLCQPLHPTMYCSHKLRN